MDRSLRIIPSIGNTHDSSITCESISEICKGLALPCHAAFPSPGKVSSSATVIACHQHNECWLFWDQISSQARYFFLLCD